MTVGIAFFGIGHAHAAGKLRAVIDSSDAELIGICEPDAEIRQQRASAEPFADAQLFEDMDGLLARDDVQGVIVDGLVSQNIPLAEAALRAGKHVLLEKPAGQTLDEFARLRQIAAEGDLLIQMGYQFRYIPGFTCLRKLVRDGALGDVFFCRARIGKDLAMYATLEAELRDYPGGTLFELGCHPMDFIIGLMGEPTAVRGTMRTDFRDDTPLADNAVAVLEFAAGIGVVESSMMEVAAFGHRRVEVYGTKGTAILQPFDATTVTLTTADGAQEIDAGSWPMFVRDIDEFAACIRGDKHPDYDSTHDWSVQRALLAACGVEPWG